MRSSFLPKCQPKISQISALPSNKPPGQKSEKFLVGILGETMTHKFTLVVGNYCKGLSLILMKDTQHTRLFFVNFKVATCWKKTQKKLTIRKVKLHCHLVITAIEHFNC